tara:strand:+ start:95 stop:271 length:177 start_codon:yes stop_codon:yes gene_type:complete
MNKKIETLIIVFKLRPYDDIRVFNGYPTSYKSKVFCVWVMDSFGSILKACLFPENKLG